MFLGGIGHWELLVILVVILLVFGARVPEVMRSLGKGVTQFKRGLRDVEDEMMNARTSTEAKSPKAVEEPKSSNAPPPADHTTAT
jgi:sec-independent protein translocase protein TatA